MLKAVVGVIFSVLLFITSSKIYLHETFDKPESTDKWVYSDDSSITHGVFSRVQKTHCQAGDFGIKSQNDSSYYHYSIELAEELDAKLKPLILGIVVQFEQEIDCGGGYVKIFEKLNQKSLTGNSEYKVMFGPDVCGYSTKKVHFIVEHKGKNYQVKDSISFESDTKPHLFMLKMTPEKKYIVWVDGEKKQEGSYKDHFDYLLPKRIDDPNDKKPENWVDEETIVDPNDVKPSDWVEEEFIPDPDAKRPEDWDDEKDGVWERDKIKNTAYKGEWTPKQIPNPEYKGVWAPKQIDNPDYVDDNTFGEFKVKFAGFDIWTVKSGTVFDDLILTDDQKEADEYSKNVLAKLKAQKEKISEAEEIKRKEEEEKRKADEAKAAEEKKDDEAKADDDTTEESSSEEL